GHRASVLEILRGRAVAVVVLFPVAHEEAVDFPALLLEEQGGDGGIYAAGEADDDTITHGARSLSEPHRGDLDRRAEVERRGRRERLTPAGHIVVDAAQD